MTTTRVLRIMLATTLLLGGAWLARRTLVQVNGTVVRDVRNGR
ncbi:hypothetical protein [Nocardioides alkalitolerans]|nr:hypothetical protein [Nocardioides alkalitolerans]